MKKLLTIGIIMLAAGCCLMFGGWRGMESAAESGAGETSSAISSIGRYGVLTRRDYTFSADGAASVVICEARGDVEIGASPDGDIHVVTHESESRSYEMAYNGSAFEITAAAAEDFTISFDFYDADDLKLEVLLPDGLDVSAETDVGDIKAERLSPRSLTAAAGYGDIKAEGVSANTVRMDTETGDIEVEKIDAESVCITSNTGDIKLKKCSARTVYLTTELGDIEAENIDAGEELVLRTEYGDIAGTLDGALDDYSVTAEAELGDSSLPSERRGGHISLDVYTACGDIEIEFER
ncbi:MAG: DUF4097 domain-containing protein [Oscillospiraceae bacterium]|nr:DUF4097 domain-containing protein [Oscillospiraceae bacterium]